MFLPLQSHLFYACPFGAQSCSHCVRHEWFCCCTVSRMTRAVSMASLFSGTLQCSPGHTCVCVLCVCVHGHISLKSAWFQNWELVPVPSRCQQEKLWQDDVAGWSRAEAEEFCCGLHPPGHFAVQYFGCIKSACCGQDLSCLE